MDKEVRITIRDTAGAMVANTMHWSGTVDREMRVAWRGMDVRSRNQSGAAAREAHSSVTNGLPSHDVNLALRVHEGHGDVTSLQQPKESNGYTAIFKVRDPMSGRGHYDFVATWNWRSECRKLFIEAWGSWRRDTAGRRQPEASGDPLG